MSWFCNKLGTACKFKTEDEQSINCEHWDPVNFLCNDKCRHCQNVDNLELARHQWAQRQRLNAPKNKRTETPERPKPQPVIMNKTGEIDAKQTSILQRLELEKRQTAAAEQIAREHEDTRTVLVYNLDRIATALEKLAGWFGDDEEGDE